MGPDLAAQEGPHAFVPDLSRPALSRDDHHHLAKVLRLRAGDPLTVSDGAGSWRPCRFGDQLEVAGEIVEEPPIAPSVTVGFAPLKGQRPELIVQKLTELGVDRILLVATARAVVRWEGDRGHRQVDRLRRVAREAGMQCRRARLPDVVGVESFDRLAGGSYGSVALAQRGGDAPSLRWRTILIGPEGGWSEAELSSCPGRVALGAHVLRAETAAITAGVVLTALRSGLVRTTT